MRQRKTALFPIAFSPSRLADCLGIDTAKVRDAIKSDRLRCYKIGSQRRVLVIDAVEWVKTWEQVR